MYSETNRRASVRRSNDEFLRRMIGGELGEIDPRLEKSAEMPTGATGGSRISCDGTPRGEFEHHHSGEQNHSGERHHSGEQNHSGETCPLYSKTPSLAMVYAPYQCWQKLLTPEAALSHGTLFEDLMLPFEGGQKYKGTEEHSTR